MAAQRACHHPGAGCQRPLGLLFPSTSAHVRPSCDITLPPDNTANLLIIAELLLELRGWVLQQEGARPVTQMALFPAFFIYLFFLALPLGCYVRRFTLKSLSWL